MGWAKYLEDNISICNDRMYYREGAYDSLKEHNRQKCNAVRFQVKECNAKHVPNALSLDNSNLNRAKRCGLELKFPVFPEKALVRKLQLNGWWWSKTAGSWCNIDSEVNRRYVKNALREWKPELFISAAC